MKDKYLQRALPCMAACAIAVTFPTLLWAQTATEPQPAAVTTVAPEAQVVTAVPAAPMVIGRTASGAVVLPQGTTIRMRTLSALNSQETKVGHRVDLEVAEDVMLNGRVVIPRGSPANGDVTLVKKKGMWGKSGKLEARVLSVRANGKDIPVRGTIGDKGDTGTAGVIGSLVVLPIAGFFVTGTSAVMPAGTAATAMLESDLPIVFAEPAANDVQPSALTVPATKPM